jgi:parallel beta-helix repeat protein
MKKGIASVLTVWVFVNVVLFSLIILSPEIELEVSATVIIVDDDGTPGVNCNYTTIQEGIDAANPGDTVFVRNGTYYENVMVDKTINLTGESRGSTIIYGGGNGDVVYIMADWVNVTEFTIMNGSYFGIFLNDVSGCNIFNNTASNNTCGIYLDFSDSNTIANNTVSNNSDGINLNTSSSNTITNNNASSNNKEGIYLGNSNWNIITNNTAASNNDCGILLMLSSLFNTIVNNNALNNAYSGILIFESSDFNTIDNNKVLNNRYGISLDNSNSNTVAYNNISNNQGVIYGGINVGASDSNTIANNTISSNNNYGIYLEFSDSNTITNNTVISNDSEGIYLKSSNSNKIFHNKIIGNVIQAFDNTNKGNQWDNGYPSGGNYWSDYGGVDIFKGPYQDIPGSDGIGDTPYIIDFNSWDNYPLMQPYKPLENYLILKQDWNLISLPFIQEEQNLTRVLGSINGWYDAVQWFYNSDQNKPWKHHKIGKPFGNDLFELNESMSFWIHITNPGDTIFLYNGTAPTSNQTIPLHPGWNMVGYPSLSNHNRSIGLNNLEFGPDVDAIQWYDAATKTWPFMGPEDHFSPGRGYWVHSKVEAGWEVPL